MGFVYKKRSSAQVDAKLRELKTGKGYQPFKQEFMVWKPKEGDNIIRILPPTWDDPDHYGLTLGFHFSIGPEHSAFICPFKFKRAPCPICEKRDTLERMGMKEEAKAFRFTMRTLVWLIDRNEETKGPQLWGMPLSKVDSKILETSKNKRTGEIYPVDDPEEGYDIFLTKTGTGLNTEYTVQIDRSPSPVNAKWVEFAVKHPLPSVLIHHDTEVIRTELEGVAPSEISDETPLPSVKHQMVDEEEETVPEVTSSAPTTRKTRSSVNRLATLSELPPRKLFRLADAYNVDIPEELGDEDIPAYLDEHLPKDADLSVV